jgi:hypothetical protein
LSTGRMRIVDAGLCGCGCATLAGHFTTAEGSVLGEAGERVRRELRFRG